MICRSWFCCSCYFSDLITKYNEYDVDVLCLSRMWRLTHNFFLAKLDDAITQRAAPGLRLTLVTRRESDQKLTHTKKHLLNKHECVCVCSLSLSFSLFLKRSPYALSSDCVCCACVCLAVAVCVCVWSVYYTKYKTQRSADVAERRVDDAC